MPQIQTTRMARIALIGLRVYLVVMLVLILSKFVGTCTAARKAAGSAAATNAPPATATVAPTNAPAKP